MSAEAKQTFTCLVTIGDFATVIVKDVESLDHAAATIKAAPVVAHSADRHALIRAVLAGSPKVIATPTGGGHA